MLPFGIGFGEVVLIGIVLLLVVGPHKLPELARTVGKGLRVVRKAGQELRDAVNLDEMRDVRREIYKPLTDWRDSEPEDVVAEPMPAKAAIAGGKTPSVAATVGAAGADGAPDEALEITTTRRRRGIDQLDDAPFRPQTHAPEDVLPAAPPSPASLPAVADGDAEHDDDEPEDDDEAAGAAPVARHDPMYHRLKAELAKAQGTPGADGGEDEDERDGSA